MVLAGLGPGGSLAAAPNFRHACSKMKINFFALGPRCRCNVWDREAPRPFGDVTCHHKAPLNISYLYIWYDSRQTIEDVLTRCSEHQNVTAEQIAQEEVWFDMNKLPTFLFAIDFETFLTSTLYVLTTWKEIL